MSASETEHSGHHVVPVRVYLAIFGSLLALTALTTWVAFVDLGEYSFLHTPIALAIAGAKATLVALWFMHLKYSVRLTWVFVTAGLIWLMILIFITGADYVGRDWDYRSEGWRATESRMPRDPGRSGESEWVVGPVGRHVA